LHFRGSRSVPLRMFVSLSLPDTHDVHLPLSCLSYLNSQEMISSRTPCASMSSLDAALSPRLAKNGMMSLPNHEPHAKLITELQGQVMHVPDMLGLFPSWPSEGRNKYYKRLKARFDEIAEMLVARAF